MNKKLSDPITIEDLQAITGPECIACVERELALRKSAFPKWVASGRLKEPKARHEIVTMSVVLELLKAHLSMTPR